MKRWLVLFMLLTAAYYADAQSFRWNRVNEDYWTTLGTVSSAPSGATTVVAAATATEILAIPDFAEVAAISIRSGTATAYIAHATAIAGNISQASLSLALFPNYEDALYYQRNHAGSAPRRDLFTASTERGEISSRLTARACWRPSGRCCSRCATTATWC